MDPIHARAWAEVRRGTLLPAPVALGLASAQPGSCLHIKSGPVEPAPLEPLRQPRVQSQVTLVDPAMSPDRMIPLPQPRWQEVLPGTPCVEM